MDNPQPARKIWITLTVLLTVVCIFQGVFLFRSYIGQNPGNDVFDSYNNFSSFLDNKYKNEKKDSFHLIDINSDGISIAGDFSQIVERKDDQGKVMAKRDIWQTFSRKIPIPNGGDYQKATVKNQKDKIIIRLPKINS